MSNRRRKRSSFDRASRDPHTAAPTSRHPQAGKRSRTKDGDQRAESPAVDEQLDSRPGSSEEKPVGRVALAYRVGIDRRANVSTLPPVTRPSPSFGGPSSGGGRGGRCTFDINLEWPSLITHSHRHGLEPTKVVPNVIREATRSLVPYDRDFFGVYWALPAPATVPFTQRPAGPRS